MGLLAAPQGYAGRDEFCARDLVYAILKTRLRTIVREISPEEVQTGPGQGVMIPTPDYKWYQGWVLRQRLLNKVVRALTRSERRLGGRYEISPTNWIAGRFQATLGRPFVPRLPIGIILGLPGALLEGAIIIAPFWLAKEAVVRTVEWWAVCSSRETARDQARLLKLLETDFRFEDVREKNLPTADAIYEACLRERRILAYENFLKSPEALVGDSAAIDRFIETYPYGELPARASMSDVQWQSLMEESFAQSLSLGLVSRFVSELSDKRSSEAAVAKVLEGFPPQIRSKIGPLVAQMWNDTFYQSLVLIYQDKVTDMRPMSQIELKRLLQFDWHLKQDLLVREAAAKAKGETLAIDKELLETRQGVLGELAEYLKR